MQTEKKDILSSIAITILTSFIVLVPLIICPLFFDSYLVKFWLVQAGIAVVLVIYAYQLLNKRISLTVYQPAGWLLLAYLLLNLLSWWMVPGPYRFAAQLTMMQTVCYVILAFLVSQYLVLDKVRDRLFISWIVTAVIVALAGMCHYGIGFRVISTLGNENFLASYLGLTIPLVLGFFWRYRSGGEFARRRALMRGLGMVILLLLVVVLYLTHSRGSWLGLVVSLSCFTILMGVSAGRRFMLMGLLIVVISVVAASPWGVDFIGNQFRGDVRFPIWESTFYMALRKPWLGWGRGAYFIFYPQFRVTEYWISRAPTDLTIHAHNEFLQIWVETGLLGLIVFLGLIIMVLRSGVLSFNCQKGSNQRFMLAGLISGVCGLLTHNLVCNNLQMPSSAVILWFALGMILAGSSSFRASFRPIRGRMLIFLAIMGFIAIIIWQTLICPLIGHYFFKRGINYRQKGIWPLAIYEYQRGINWYPWDVEMHYRLAFAFTQVGELDLAIAKYNKVREMAPDYGNIYRNLGHVYTAKQEWRQAIINYWQALRINPYDTTSVFRLYQAKAKLKAADQGVNNGFE